MITLETAKHEIVSTEVFVNASYGYHVHAELVGRQGTISLAPASLTLLNRDGAGGHSYPDNGCRGSGGTAVRSLTGSAP